MKTLKIYMPNYYYRKLENDYEDIKSQINRYNKMEFTTVLLIFIIFGVIYIILKDMQKNFTNENNAKYNSRKQKAIADAKNIKWVGERIWNRRK